MSKSFRNAVIKLAFERPDLQHALVPLLQKRAMEFNSRQEFEKYMKEHPGADRKNHSFKHEDKQSEGMSHFEKYHARELKDTLEWAQMHVESAISSRHGVDFNMIERAFDKLDEKISEAKKGTESAKGKEALKFYKEEIKSLRKGLDEGLKQKDSRKPAKPSQSWLDKVKDLFDL